MRPSLDIRSGSLDDANRLAVLATQVWLHTYATSGITADIAEYVLHELTPEKYLALLNDPTCQLLAAASGESLVGLAVVKFGIPCPAGNYSSAELQTLYVQEHFVGCGAGKSLLRAAETEARQRSNGVLWLAVNAKNARAIAFYAHQGYTKVGTTYFVLGEGRHENHVLIGADAQPLRQGDVLRPVQETSR
jgi:ribosomal protein S18 acetylase RimI-like enzyme